MFSSIHISRFKMKNCVHNRQFFLLVYGTPQHRQVAPSGLHLNGMWILSQTVDFFPLKKKTYL